MGKDGSLQVDEILSWGAGARTSSVYVDGPEVEWHKYDDDADHNEDWEHRINDNMVASLHYNPRNYGKWELEISVQAGNTIMPVSKDSTEDIPQSRYKDALIWATRELISFGIRGDAIDILVDLYTQRKTLEKGPEYRDEYMVGGDF